MTQEQRETNFLLMSKQLSLAVVVADEAFGGSKNPYQAVCHVIGIAAYVSELANQLKRDWETQS